MALHSPLFSPIKSKEVVEFEVLNKQLKEKIDAVTLTDSSFRPYSDSELWNYQNFNTFVSYGNNVTLFNLFELQRFSDVLNTIFHALKRKVLKKGFDIQPKQDGASPAQKKIIEEFCRHCNQNGQSLKEVFMELEDDLNWADNAYLLVLKDYYLNGNNEFLGGDVREVLRINPLTVERLLDAQERLGFEENKREGSRPCYVQFIKDENSGVYKIDRKGLVYDSVNFKTGLPNLRVHYKIQTASGYFYYSKSEIKAVSKFKPSKRGGFSPLFALFNKVFTLLAMDYYVRTEYSSEKPSKKMILFKSSNLNSLMSSVKDYKEKVRAQPHALHPLAVQTENKGNVAEIVDFMKSLDEMQFTEVRNEYRNAIGSVYGVSPLFQNDTSTSGGLNNEGLQITVTNEAIESDQEIFNLEIIPFIFERNLGITDWEITLFPNEEEDEAWKEDLFAKKLANAKAYSDLGGKVKYNKDGEFIYEPADLEVKAQPQMNNGFNFTPLNNTSEQMQNQDLQDNFNEAGELEKEVVGESKSPSELNKMASLKEVKEFETALEKEFGKIVSKLNLKEFPSDQELMMIISELTKNMDSQLKAKSANRIKAIYRKEQERVARELKDKSVLGFGQKDRNVVEALKRDPMFQQAFSDISENTSKKLRAVISEMYQKPEELTINNIVTRLKEELETNNSKLRMIARTESSKIANASRLVSYQKSPEFQNMKFKWVGPDDDRTTIMSKEIKQASQNGLSWSELIATIKDVVNRHNHGWIVNEIAPVTHPNSRHTFIRVMG